MLKHINIRNFQSHKNTTLSLVPGLNVFVGKTNSGKSAIFRAFQKVLRNTPKGGDFVNLDTDECTIDIDGVKRVIKVRRKDDKVDVTVNRFFIGKELFDKVGRGLPPEEVLNYLKVSKPLEVADIVEDFNFITQRDPSFLISKFYTPSTVAKFFDYLSGTSILNLCLREVKSRLLQNTQEIKRLKLRLTEIDSELVLYNFIPILNELNKKNIDLQKKQTKRNIIFNLSESLRELNNDLKEVSSNIIPQSVLLNIHLKLDSFNILNKIQSLNITLKELNFIDVSVYKVKLSKFLIMLDILNIKTNLKNLQVFNIKELKFNQLKLEILLDYFQKDSDKRLLVIQYTEGISNLENQKQLYLTTLKTFGKCPICGAVT